MRTLGDSAPDDGKRKARVFRFKRELEQIDLLELLSFCSGFLRNCSLSQVEEGAAINQRWTCIIS
jgi:hypothetical protein